MFIWAVRLHLYDLYEKNIYKSRLIEKIDDYFIEECTDS